ncbi:MAG: hypothetical protein MUE73_20685, partial [Planctomycetes bacterium]|nr:hypothetical protein [Planctomycetota bacterium]
FITSVKVVAPLLLTGLLVWNVVSLFQGGGVYGASSGYSLLSNILGGWAITALVFASGFIVLLIVKRREKRGFVEEEIEWEGGPGREPRC